ncbi:MAG: glucosaminidase domain-containing protein [Bergeyella zoohelcum]|nr:glucosaminidase domain-containing protein [Bergeyella zoohelcum]
MKKTILSFLCLVGSAHYQSQQWTTDEQYIQQFAQYAVEEMEKYQIPASITLAQGILETGGGQSRLAREGNNHFGIKCKEDWTGKTMKHTDDAPNECFRVYDDPRQSYEDHSKFLKYRKFYQKLFTLDMRDYKAWAHGLKKAGYATNPRYAYILIDKIEKHRLYEFDNVSSKNVNYAIAKLYPNWKNDNPVLAKNEEKKVEVKPVMKPSMAKVPTSAKTIIENTNTAKTLNDVLVKNHPNGGMKYIVLPADMRLSAVAKKFGIAEKKLIKWNDLFGTNLRKNDILFLESKRGRGNTPTYTAQAGDTMRLISQKFGVKLSRLYAKNRMSDKEQPRLGQLIYLQTKKPRS